MPYSLIETALGHPSKIRVLRVLKKPGMGYQSINQLARSTSLNAVTLARTLRSLQSLGLANYIQAGKAQLWRLSEGYAANAISPILDAIENVPSQTDQLKGIINKIPPPPQIESITLYGSVARGEINPGSDIDLFILRSEKWSDDIEKFLTQLTDEISRYFWMTPSFLTKTPSEFRKMTSELRKNILGGIVLYEKKSD